MKNKKLQQKTFYINHIVARTYLYSNVSGEEFAELVVFVPTFGV